jgi:hypothetical protein
MGRFTARSGILAVALVIGSTLVGGPLGSATAAKSAPAKNAVVNATSYGLISIAQSSPKNAMAVGYSRLPSTEPIGMQWNGTTWTVTPMPHPSGGALLYTVTAVPRTDEYLAAGEACTSQACPAAYILDWDGTSWSKMTLPHFGESTDIASISASSPTNAWAVGQECNDVRGNCNPITLFWNGKAWSSVKIPKLNSIYADVYQVVDVSPVDVWAVGSSIFGPYALNYNGHAWVNVAIPGSSQYGGALNSAASIPRTSELWAVEAASGGQFLLKWNGTSWHGFGLPLHGYYSLNDVAASSTSNAWLVGTSQSATGTEPSLTVHWNGLKWIKVKSPSPSPANELFSVTTGSSMSAWAVGVHYSPLQQTAAGLILDYNGTSWSEVKAPTPKVPSDPTPDASRMTEADRF